MKQAAGLLAVVATLTCAMVGCSIRRDGHEMSKSQAADSPTQTWEEAFAEDKVTYHPRVRTLLGRLR